MLFWLDLPQEVPGGVPRGVPGGTQGVTPGVGGTRGVPGGGTKDRGQGAQGPKGKIHRHMAVLENVWPRALSWAVIRLRVLKGLFLQW